MKFEKSKKGFSLVELIITVVIIGVLSVIAYIGINGTGNWFKNEKVKDDLIAISNALENYKRDHFGAYPIQDPGDNANMLCFAADASYTHDCDSSAFRQGMIDNDLLTKRYLQEVPTDPRTDSRYVYGVSADGKYFQVAGVVYEDGNYRAETVENLGKGFYLPSLIRAYDSPNFVVHESSDNLPYSPNTTTITAKLDNINGAVTINGDPASTDVTLYAGDIIEVSAGGTVNVYFSDGSVSTLGSATNTSTLEILDTSEVAENDEDNIITKIYLKLTQGKIWNKVVRLASESEFNIETTAAIAGVRGTEFGIDADNTELIVYSGEVRMRLKLPDELALGNNPVPFDIDVFTEDMIATPDPITGDPLLYDNITDQVVGTGDPLSGDNETYFNDIYDQSTIHNGLVPYIVAVDETNVDYKVYVSFNGITSQPGYLDSDVHNGFEIYSGVDQDRQLDGLNVISHGEVPDINYQSDPGLDYYQTYYFDYNFSGIGAPIVLQAFKDGSYSNISWPPIQFSDTPSGTIYDYTNPEITPELALQAYIAGGRSGYAVNEPIGLEAIVMNEKDPGNSEYLWSFKSVPTGSVVYLNPVDELLDFYGDIEGQYIVGLTVMNDDEWSEEAVAVIEVGAGGGCPPAEMTFSPDLTGEPAVQISTQVSWSQNDPCAWVDFGSYFLRIMDEDTGIPIYESDIGGQNSIALEDYGVTTDLSCGVYVFAIDTYNNQFAELSMTFDTESGQQYSIDLVEQYDAYVANIDSISFNLNSPTNYYNAYTYGNPTPIQSDILGDDPFIAASPGDYDFALSYDTAISTGLVTVVSESMEPCYGADRLEETPDDIAYVIDGQTCVCDTNYIEVGNTCEPLLLVQSCIGIDDAYWVASLNGYENEAMETYYDADDNACWTMAQNDTDACDDVCTNVLSLSCIDDEWNDVGGAICNVLIGGSTGYDGTTGSAPFFYPGPNRCYERISGYTYTYPENVCNAPGLGSDKKRTCKCE